MIKKTIKNIAVILGLFLLFPLIIALVIYFAPPSENYTLGGLNAHKKPINKEYINE